MVLIIISSLVHIVSIELDKISGIIVWSIKLSFTGTEEDLVYILKRVDKKTVTKPIMIDLY